MALTVSKQMIGISLIVISSICFAFVPNAAKLALDDGVSLYYLLLSRFVIGSAILLPYLIITRTSFAIPREGYFQLILTGISALLLLAAKA